MITSSHYRRFAIYIMILCTLLSLVPAKLAFAASGNKLIFSSPQMSTSTTVGNPIDVTVTSYIDADPGTAGSVSGSVTYPSNLLKVLSTSTSGTKYNASGSPSITVGGSSISFSGQRSSSPSGMALVFSVRFQAIGAGTAIIKFSDDSTVNGATLTSDQRTNGVFSLTNPPQQSPTPTPSTSTKPSTSPRPTIQPSTSTTPSASPIPTPDATAPDSGTDTTPDPTGVISDVSVNPTYTGGTVTWKVNADHPSSSFAYGSQSSSLDKKAEAKSGAGGTYTATVGELLPGVRYYFVISGSGDGNKNGTYTGTLITDGFPVEITVTENGVPANSAQVHIGNINKVTGSNGRITLGLAAGTYTGTITTDTASKDITLTVVTKTIPSDGSAPASQTAQFDLTSSVLSGGPGSGNTVLVFVGVLLGGTALIAIGFVGFMAYRRNKFESGTGGSRPSTTVIIDDGYDWRQESTTSPTPPSSTSQIPHHNNSVYIDDEEPVDMFDTARK